MIVVYIASVAYAAASFGKLQRTAIVLRTCKGSLELGAACCSSVEEFLYRLVIPR